MRYLAFMIFLVVPTMMFAKTTIKHNSTSKINIDNEIDNFDNETDDEAMDSLKKRIKEKKKDVKEKKKEMNGEKNIDNTPKPDESKLEDTVIDDSHNTKERNIGQHVDSNAGFGSKGRVDSNSGFDNNDKNNQNDNYDDSEKQYSTVFSISGGFGMQYDEYPTSHHFGLEYSIYKNPMNMMKQGMSLGAGLVELDNYIRPYVDIAFTGMFSFINPSWGPFLRADLGLMAWWRDNNSQEYNDNNEEVDVEYVGVFLKAGAGFLLGNDNGGLSLQMLYTIHATTAGTNNGLELQLGFHF